MDIKNIKVKPTSKTEEEVCFALFEAAGCKWDGYNKNQHRNYLRVHSIDGEFGWFDDSFFNEVSFTEFVWSQAPDNASYLYWFSGRIIWNTSEDTKKYDDVFLVSTRPQLIKKEWVPDIGVECEYSSDGGATHKRCLIVGIHTLTGRFIVERTLLIHAKNNWIFRPIQSDRDKLIEQLKKDCEECGVDMVNLNAATLIDKGWKLTNE